MVVRWCSSSRVPVVALNWHGIQFSVGDLHADRVGTGVEISLNREAGAGGGACDQFDDGAMGVEGLGPRSERCDMAGS